MKKRTNKLLSTLMALVMVVGLLPVVAAPAQAATEEPKPEYEYDRNPTWIDPESLGDELEKPGVSYIKLTEDSPYRGGCTIPAGAVKHLDLNGFTTGSYDEDANEGLIVKGTLVIYDTSPDGTGRIADPVKSLTGYVSHLDVMAELQRGIGYRQTTITVESGGNLIVNGGTIGGGFSEQEWITGAECEGWLFGYSGYMWLQNLTCGVHVTSGGKCTLNGGMIRGRGEVSYNQLNTGLDPSKRFPIDQGAAVWVDSDGKFFMNGGTLQGRGGGNALKSSYYNRVISGTVEAKTLDKVLYSIKTNGADVGSFVKDLQGSFDPKINSNDPYRKVEKKTATRREVTPRSNVVKDSELVAVTVPDVHSLLYSSHVYPKGTDALFKANQKGTFFSGDYLNRDYRSDTFYNITYTWHLKSTTEGAFSYTSQPSEKPTFSLKNFSPYLKTGEIYQLTCEVNEHWVGMDRKYDYVSRYESPVFRFDVTDQDLVNPPSADFDVPAVGKHPDMTPELPSGADYTATVEWREKLVDGAAAQYIPMAETDRFQFGHSYAANVTFTTTSGGIFGKRGATINKTGMTGSFTDNSMTGLTFSLDFDLTTPSTIEQIQVSTKEPWAWPIVGMAPQIGKWSVDEEAPYTIQEIRYAPAENYAGSVDKFQHSSRYVLQVWLQAKEGYQFDSQTTAQVTLSDPYQDLMEPETRDAEIVRFSGDTIYVIYEFPETYHAITDTGGLAIIGPLGVGETLTAIPTIACSQMDREQFDYTWYRGTAAEGTPVGTGKTYTVQEEDVGSKLTCFARSADGVHIYGCQGTTAAPVNDLYWDGRTARWQAVPDAESYTVTVKRTAPSVDQKHMSNITGTELDVISGNLDSGNGTYEFTVTPSNGTESSPSGSQEIGYVSVIDGTAFFDGTPTEWAATGETITVKAAQKPGKVFDHWEQELSGGSSKQAVDFDDRYAAETTFAAKRGAVNLTAVFRDADAASSQPVRYRVSFCQQELDDPTVYTSVSMEFKEGIAGTATEAEAVNFPGFTPQAFEQQTIDPKGYISGGQRKDAFQKERFFSVCTNQMNKERRKSRGQEKDKIHSALRASVQR